MGMLRTQREEKKSFVFPSSKFQKMISACLLVLFLTYHPGTFFFIHITEELKKIKSSPFECTCPVRSTMVFLIGVSVYTDLLMLWLTGWEGCDLLSVELKAVNAH